MSYDDLSTEDALELLRQTRFELSRCKKSLAFKENLLIELEFEVSELARINQQLQKDIDCQRRRDLRRRSLEQECYTDDDDLDELPQRWTPPEPQLSEYTSELPSEPKQSAPCENCRVSDIERNDLINVIEELNEQKGRLSDVNQLLLKNLNSTTEQLAEVAVDASKEKALRKSLEASLECLTVEKELVERDLRDFRESTLSAGQLLEVPGRGQSIGSSIGDELGLERNFGERNFPLFFDWDAALRAPENDCFEQSENMGLQKHFFPEVGNPFGLPHRMHERNTMTWREPSEELCGKIDDSLKNGETRTSAAEGEYESDPEEATYDAQTPTVTFSWRSLMCLPLRRCMKRRRSPPSTLSMLSLFRRSV